MLSEEVDFRVHAQSLPMWWWSQTFGLTTCFLWLAILISLQIFQSRHHNCSLVWFFMTVLASNLLILAHGCQNIDKLFIMNSYLAGCCIAKTASRRRHLSVLYTWVWKLSTAVQCCQNVDKLLQVYDDVFVAKGYEHIWASSGYRLKWAFCGSLNDVEARAYG